MNFLKCGLAGWCMEILFTALGSLQKREMRLMGRTSLWMFPIYGSACLLTPLFGVLKKWPVVVRGSVYALLIFAGEFLSGRFLHKHRLCPWDYGHCKWHICRSIRLDFFPNWFFAGLLFERLLDEKAPESKNPPA